MSNSFTNLAFECEYYGDSHDIIKPDGIEQKYDEEQSVKKKVARCHTVHDMRLVEA